MEQQWHDEEDPRLPSCYLEQLLEALLLRKQNAPLLLCEEHHTIFYTTLYLNKSDQC